MLITRPAGHPSLLLILTNRPQHLNPNTHLLSQAIEDGVHWSVQGKLIQGVECVEDPANEEATISFAEDGRSRVTVCCERLVAIHSVHAGLLSTPPGLDEIERDFVGCCTSCSFVFDDALAVNHLMELKMGTCGSSTVLFFPGFPAGYQLEVEIVLKSELTRGSWPR